MPTLGFYAANTKFRVQCCFPSYVPVVGKFLSSFLMLNNEVFLAATMTVSVARLCIIKVARIRVGEFLTTKYNREYEECDCVCSKVKSMPCNFTVHNYSRIKIWYYSCLCRLLGTWEVFGHFFNYHFNFSTIPIELCLTNFNISYNINIVNFS